MDKLHIISVIVPVYNTAPWLRRCLDSICAQTYRNLEILCVNDGSTDNSAEILAEYAAKDARIKVIEQQNAGVSAARNKATAMALGEWVTYVDSDDWLRTDILASLISRISDEVDVASFSAVMEWEQEDSTPEPGSRWFTRHEAWEELACTPESADAVSRTVWGKLWRRSVIEQNGVHSPVGLRHEDDAFFYLFMRHCRRILFSPVVGYHYLQRSDSFMHGGRSALETAGIYAEVIRYVMDWLRARGVNPSADPWCRMFAARVYEDRYHSLSGGDYTHLAEMYYSLLVEQGLMPALRGDYRFRRMEPVRGWRRLFLSRYLNTELWRFLGLPVCKLIYDGNRVAACRFVLWSQACRKLKSLLRLS